MHFLREGNDWVHSVSQTQPLNMLFRPSSTAWELRWRSTASPWAPSATPSSAALHPEPQPPPSPHGHVSKRQRDESDVQTNLFFAENVIWASCLLAAVLYTKKPLGVSPDEAATEIVRTLNNKRKEVVIAPSLPKVAIYARSLLPNVLFAVMAAGVKDTAASEKM